MFPKWLSQLLLNHFAVCAQYRFPTFHRFGLMVPEVFILCCLTHLSLGCGKSAHYDKGTWPRRYGYLMAVKQDGSQGPLQRWPNFILLGLTVAFQHHHRLGMKSPAQFGDILDPIYGMDEEKKNAINWKTFREPKNELHVELTGSKCQMLPKNLAMTHSICHDCIFVSCEENKHGSERQGWSQYLIPWL